MVTEQIDFSKMNGLVPAVVQDARDNRVLMLGFMNEEALRRTLEDRKVTFWSRSRRTLWQKGETSGNVLDLVSVHVDCDRDSLLIKAVPSGPVCHTGAETCFEENERSVLAGLESTIARRYTERPEGSYTTRLFAGGTPAIAQKVGEEAVEVVVAALAQDARRLTEESADLLYHLLVLLRDRGVSLDDVTRELARRRK